MINAKGKFDPVRIAENPNQPSSNTLMDKFLTNFKGANRIQRGGDWTLKGGGSNTASFLSAGSLTTDQTPALNNVYALGNSSFKWSNIAVVMINGATPLAGTKVYYVSDTSGGTVNRKLTFSVGILTSET